MLIPADESLRDEREVADFYEASFRRKGVFCMDGGKVERKDEVYFEKKYHFCISTISSSCCGVWQLKHIKTGFESY